MHGNNILSISHSYSGSNLFGVEWVLTNGEIVNVGAPGSGEGWFSGDGPGPSLRGILRGALGAMGGLGVFTKCAGHLHPWPGPEKLEADGVSPYDKTEMPSHFEYHSAIRASNNYPWINIPRQRQRRSWLLILLCKWYPTWVLIM